MLVNHSPLKPGPGKPHAASRPLTQAAKPSKLADRISSKLQGKPEPAGRSLSVAPATAGRHTGVPQHHHQPHAQHHPKTSPQPQPKGPAGLVQHCNRDGELLLMPGHLYFGQEPRSIRTLLGSCVALTLWHPTRRIGGMCHYLLPERRRNPDQPLDGRYGTEALEVLIEMLQRLGTRASEYEAHLYGGADTLPDHVAHKTQVGVRNIEVGWGLVDQHGFQLMGVDVGDNVPRTVRLDLRSGEVQMRRSER